MTAPCLFYSGGFVLPLPPEHRFPMAKYARLHAAVVADGFGHRVGVPPAATDDELEAAHDPAWVAAVTTGRLDRAAVRRIGFPWSPGMVERSRRSVGATLAATRAALESGIGINLAGGTHHALADRAEGYCVFNDVAVAVRVLRRERRLARVLIVDCDVHQGNGTAAIFSGDPDTVTVDLYGARNFPFEKVPATVDIALADGTTDEPYLHALGGALDEGLARGPFSVAYYVAGADPYVGDRLGRLGLSMQGLAARDAMVCRALVDAGLPVVVTMAGGYADPVEDTVSIHRATVQAALAISDSRSLVRFQSQAS